MANIEKLHVLKFRNLTDQYLLPNNNINLILGQNGQGKTNFIESIYYLGHGRSFKTKSLKDIIPFDEQQIKITAVVDKQKVSIQKSRDKSQVLIEEEKISSNSFLSQILPIQVISPDRGFVVGGSPKLKRSYLDWGVFHNNNKVTLKAYKTYKKTLKNINTLLASGRKGQLDEWFTQFASLSVEITKGRMDYVEKLKTLLNDQSKGRLNSLIKTNDDFTFHIQTGWPKEVAPLSQEQILEYLLKNKTNFLKTKHLSYGPHRANIEYLLNNRNESFLSRGEQKKMSIVFWMLQVMILVQKKTKPIVLIDDISSELDQKKIKSIIDYLTEINIQIFITDIANKDLPLDHNKATVFEIKSGVLKAL
jgi:DNA replication and repair protein RecF